MSRPDIKKIPRNLIQNGNVALGFEKPPNEKPSKPEENVTTILQVYQIVSAASKKAIIGSYNWNGKILKVGHENKLYYNEYDFEFKFITDTVISVDMEELGNFLFIYNVPNEMLKVVPVVGKPKNMSRVEGKFRMSDFLQQNVTNVTNITQVIQQ